MEESNHEFFLKNILALKTIRTIEQYVELVIANNLELFLNGMKKVTDMVLEYNYSPLKSDG